jgi:hypothetical protein
MRRFLLATALSLSLVLPAQSAETEEVVAFALSPDDASAAIIVHAPAVELVIRGEKERRLALPRYAEAESISRRLTPTLSWSADSRVLALEYLVDDQTTAVEVVDVSSMSVVWGRAVAGAKWAKEGHDLYVVPSYPVGDWQSKPGLLKVDASTRKEQVMAGDHYFTGEFDVGRDVVLGREVRLVDGKPVFSLARVDIVALSAVAAPAPCPRQIAADLLDAIQQPDPSAVQRIANDPDVFDTAAMQYLLATDPEYRLPGDGNLRSAHAVLAGKKVLTKVVSEETSAGGWEIEVLYLPVGKYADLRALAEDKDARAFDDFVACLIHVDAEGRTHMTHVCYAETDVL